MSEYECLTTSFITPKEKYINEKWVHSEETNFGKKQGLARVGNFSLIPFSFITSIADTAIGLAAGVAAIITLGLHQQINELTHDHLENSKLIIANPYRYLLKAVNPKAFGSDYSTKQSKIKEDGFGFLTDFVYEKIIEKAEELSDSNNFFKRHIISRLTYALSAVSAVITRIADAIIGFIAAPLSFITIGKIDAINHLAFRALQAPGIIFDLFFCTVNIINPHE